MHFVANHGFVMGKLVINIYKYIFFKTNIDTFNSRVEIYICSLIKIIVETRSFLM